MPQETNSIYAQIPKASGTPETGLSTHQAQQLLEAGKNNIDADPKAKSVTRIFSENIFTLFNAINILLAALVFVTGSFRNMLFMLVVVCNVAIGIVQELRARAALQKLSLLVSEKIFVLRDGSEQLIAPDQIVLGDVLKLSSGMQIPCDARVISGKSQINEALLTGEANLVEKAPGAALLSGSFIASGHVLAEAVAVGADSFASKLSASAKTYQKPASQIMDTLQYIIKMATFYLIPVGILLFVRTFFAEGAAGTFSFEDFPWAMGNLSTSILTTTAALVGMIPQGLVLLTSAVLTLSVIRLAANKVLVKQFFSIETLARVDVLCLDKTGTITSGKMKVKNIFPAKSGGKDTAKTKDKDKTETEDKSANKGTAVTIAEKDVLKAAGWVMEANKADANQTALAILHKWEESPYSGDDRKGELSEKGSSLPHTKAPKIARAIPFLSERKYSGCTLKSGESYVVGASEFIFSKETGADPISPPSQEVSETARFVCVAKVEGFSEEGRIEGKPELMGWIALGDELRRGIQDTLAFFEQQGVRLYVFSGDDPKTAAAIAAAAGLKLQKGESKLSYLDAGDIVDVPEEKIREVLKTTTVVGRCTPQIKQKLLKVLRSEGHTTAMTGDGVNDILAMRAADTSIAMAQGAEAARVVAELVLVDNDFSHMPHVVDEGRRSINNLIRSASLFLEKTVFSMALAAFALILPPYPILPIQLTLLSGALIGIPSFALALEPNHNRVEGDFFKKVFSKALPPALAISISIAAAMIYCEAAGIGSATLSTIASFIIAAVGLALLVKISQPLNLFRATLIVLMAAFLLVGFLGFGWFFEVVPFSPDLLGHQVIFGGVGLLLFAIFSPLFSRKPR